jgi:preprotein translocase subunit YajC
MLTSTVLSAVLMAASSTTTKKPTTTTGGILEVLFFGVLFLLFYFGFLRPRSQAARRQRDTLMELTPGDEVLTAGGIYGTVLDVEVDRVTLETAPGTRLTVVRSTIARKIVQPDADGAEENWDDDAHNGAHDGAHDSLDGPPTHDDAHAASHNGLAEAAGWHSPEEEKDSIDGHEAADHDADVDAGAAKDKPGADGAPGPQQGGGR